MTLGDAARDSGVAVWPASGDLAGQREARGTRGCASGVRPAAGAQGGCVTFLYFSRAISDVFGRFRTFSDAL